MYIDYNFRIKKLLLMSIIFLCISIKTICFAYENFEEYIYYFCSEEISFELREFMMGRSFKENNDIISFDDLRYVRVLYWGIDDEIHEGEMVVNKDVSEDVIDIFKELFRKKYKISQMKLFDCYNSDFEASLSDNNTISFYMSDNCGNLEEKYHSLGLAIDINPLFNGLLEEKKTDIKSIDKNHMSDDMAISSGDDCYSAFISRGWIWSGDLGSKYKCFLKEK